MPSLLDEIAFRDRTRAFDSLARVTASLAPAMQTGFPYLLAASPDPDTALHYLERLCLEQPECFKSLAQSPTGLQYLIAIFSNSHFLSAEVLREPAGVDALLAKRDLHRSLTSAEYVDRLNEYLGPGIPSALSLAQFRRRKILRILLRDVLGYCDVAEVTQELTALADSVLEVLYQRIRTDLIARHGEPRVTDEMTGESRSCGFSIIALGKLGGRELNYSSDIDLMFVYSGNGRTDGSQSISNKEFFKKVSNQLTDLLSTYTAEGVCYRVDLRLRPDGRLGEVCLSLDGAKNYYRTRGRDWELQMLIKARVAAGEREPGRELLEFVEPLIYASTLDFSAVETVSLARERFREKLNARRNPDEFDIKLARGGIRDIEFLVQCLQRLHGGREPWVRHGGTLLALSRLYDKDLLSETEYSTLSGAYGFLRHLEHRLQFDEDRQTHTLPRDRAALGLLARRMPSAELGSEPTAENLLASLNAHLERVQSIYERVIHAQNPNYYMTPSTPLAVEVDNGAAAAFFDPSSVNLVRFLDQRAPSFARNLERAQLRRGFRPFLHFLERVFAQPEWLEALNDNSVLAGYVFDIFEHSPYFAEQLIRRPEWLGELSGLPGGGQEAPRYGEMTAALSDPADLRRFFHREMFRIQSESLCLRTPIFETLSRTSTLADAAVASAYDMAVERVLGSHPPKQAGYKPEGQMMVVALGRLGMREFDLGSDADLVFVLRDNDMVEHRFWTRVAERMIDLLTTYTGEGIMFAVDTRLRPSGREGELVQSETAYKDYFASKAEAWEGITYMKSRGVAGDGNRATEFLHALQDVDWRRYGQGGRSKQKLKQMRLRLEREQGEANPLKAGAGGYYDIDFALMYLRLKGAGIFFKVLNTPERIDVLEKMGHLERADAEFLSDAATLYRSIDHALRLFSGHAEGMLPNAPAQLEVIQELVLRWTPDHLHDQPAPIELAQIRRRTREYFDRLFG